MMCLFEDGGSDRTIALDRERIVESVDLRDALSVKFGFTELQELEGPMEGQALYLLMPSPTPYPPRLLAQAPIRIKEGEEGGRIQTHEENAKLEGVAGARGSKMSWELGINGTLPSREGAQEKTAITLK
ncbi:hypothetical protein Tco_0246769 [Tanacetum coccineum]